MVGRQKSAHPAEHTIQNWQQVGLSKKAMKAVRAPTINIQCNFYVSSLL